MGEIEKNDVHLIQDPQMFLQIIKAIARNDGNHTINIINGIQVGEIRIGQEKGPDEDGKEFDFTEFLKLMPEPRLENLKLMAIGVAQSLCDTKLEVAKFLGISPRILYPGYRQKKELTFKQKEDET